MKKLITFIAAMLITIMASAAEPYTVYCSLSGASYSQIDYGQESLLRNTLVDEDGRAIYFNSIIGAMNYMSARGWRFVGERKSYSQNMWDKLDISVSTTLIFAREITSPEQITDGIITRQMLKEQLEEHSAE
ncbi:MAG: hypothetical protein J6U48_05155 [Alistipes sp.]|nr:hypothetical protein [Alistipes sp.]